jgi:hypothetical protein
MFSSLQPYSGNDAESMGKGMGSERVGYFTLKILSENVCH